MDLMQQQYVLVPGGSGLGGGFVDCSGSERVDDFIKEEEELMMLLS